LTISTDLTSSDFDYYSDAASSATITLSGSDDGDSFPNVIIGGNGVSGSASYTWATGDSGFHGYSVTDAEFKDKFPAWERIQEMCKQYPALKIAFDKFRTTYKLVKDDYDTPKE
jgi:hypothetical protein